MNSFYKYPINNAKRYALNVHPCCIPIIIGNNFLVTPGVLLILVNSLSYISLITLTSFDTSISKGANYAKGTNFMGKL